MNGYSMYKLCALFLTVILMLICVQAARRVKTYLVYPTRTISAKDSTHTIFDGHAVQNELTCFSNEDAAVPMYLQTLGCLTFLPYFECTSVWGSRSIFITANSSVEFYKVNDFVSTGSGCASINATRWLQLEAEGKEIMNEPAEPLHICARSLSWKQPSSPASFTVQIRPVYLREKDKNDSLKKMLIHILLMSVASSTWLLPYLIALSVAFLSYSHAMKYFLVILGTCSFVVLLVPFMLTKKNLHLSRLYFNYFFTRIQAEETRMVIKQRLPVFQAVFFSCALVCIGTSVAYLLYSYCGIDREIRNQLMKFGVALSAGWMIFTICRSFERFVKNWAWVGMATALAIILDKHLNQLCKVQLIVSSMVISLVLRMIIWRIRRYLRTNSFLQFSLWGNILKPWRRVTSTEKVVRIESDNIIAEVPCRKSSEDIFRSPVLLDDEIDNERGDDPVIDRAEANDSLDQHDEDEEEYDDDDEDDLLSIESLLGYEPVVRVKSFERSAGGALPASLSVPLWKQLASNTSGDTIALAIDSNEGQKSSVAADIINAYSSESQDNTDESLESLNRFALSDYFNIDLSCLVGVSCSQRNQYAVMNNLIGNISSSLHIAGPLKLNDTQVWYPYLIKNSRTRAVFASLCNGCSFLKESILTVSQAGACIHKRSILVQAPSFSSSLEIERWLTQDSNVSILQEIAKQILFGSDHTAKPDTKLRVLVVVEGDNIKVSIHYTSIRSNIHAACEDNAVEAVAAAIFEQFPMLTLKSIDSLHSIGSNLFCGLETTFPISALTDFEVDVDQLLFFHKLERSQVFSSLVAKDVFLGLSALCECLGIDSSLLLSTDLLQSVVIQPSDTYTGRLRIAVLVKFDERILQEHDELTPAHRACRKLLGCRFDFASFYSEDGGLSNGDIWRYSGGLNNEEDNSGVSSVTEVLAGAALTIYLGSLIGLSKSKKMLFENCCRFASL